MLRACLHSPSFHSLYPKGRRAVLTATVTATAANYGERWRTSADEACQREIRRGRWRTSANGDGRVESLKTARVQALVGSNPTPSVFGFHHSAVVRACHLTGNLTGKPSSWCHQGDGLHGQTQSGLRRGISASRWALGGANSYSGRRSAVGLCPHPRGRHSALTEARWALGQGLPVSSGAAPLGLFFDRWLAVVRPRLRTTTTRA